MNNNTMNPWTYPEVEKVLDDKRSPAEVAREVDRTPAAIGFVRTMAKQWEQGKTKPIASKGLQTHFKQYFVNKGKMQFDRVDPQPVQTTMQQDKCEERIAALLTMATDTFENLKSYMVEIADITATHNNHAREKELQGLRLWKTEVEKELQDLRDFKATAKRGNFASMMRKVTGGVNA